MIIYDIEIKKAIRSKNEDLREGIEYCDGWHDHEKMGISCICAYDYRQDRFRVFCDDNIAEFVALACDTDLLVGFNNIGFDNKVIRANGLFDVTSNVEGKIDFDAKSYDILREIWAGAGLGPNFRYPSHAGYGLDNVVRCNFPDAAKTGHGAVAPVDYQRGNWGNLIDYCLADIWLTKKLLDLIMDKGEILNPVGEGVLKIRKPG